MRKMMTLKNYVVVPKRRTVSSKMMNMGAKYLITLLSSGFVKSLIRFFFV